MASFVLSFFPLDVFDEIWDVIESVSERFLTYPWSGGGSFYNGHDILTRSPPPPSPATKFYVYKAWI